MFVDEEQVVCVDGAVLNAICGYEVFYSLQTRFGALSALHGFDRDASFGAEVTTKSEWSFR